MVNGRLHVRIRIYSLKKSETECLARDLSRGAIQQPPERTDHNAERPFCERRSYASRQGISAMAFSINKDEIEFFIN